METGLEVFTGQSHMALGVPPSSPWLWGRKTHYQTSLLSLKQTWNIRASRKKEKKNPQEAGAARMQRANEWGLTLRAGLPLKMEEAFPGHRGDGQQEASAFPPTSDGRLCLAHGCSPKIWRIIVKI